MASKVDGEEKDGGVYVIESNKLNNSLLNIQISFFFSKMIETLTQKIKIIIY